MENMYSHKLAHFSPGLSYNEDLQETLWVIATVL
jgi:hypothetical protein